MDQGDFLLYPFLLYTSPMTVANHLTLNELRRRAKKAKDPIEKDRFLAVYHAKRGLTAKEIARIIPNTPRWVQETVRRYNLEGPEALKDKRHQNPGQKPKLTPEERMRVLEALQGPPPDGGLWTGPKLRDWVERELGKRLSLYPIYRLLHEMGFALRVPRPRHRKADGEAQEACNLFAQVQEARAEGRRVRLLAYDGHARRAYLGHRLGLRPVYRRVWARRGERPLAVGAHRYRWFYVCTFVEPETGESLSLLVDGVDTEVMGWVLRELRAWLREGEEAWVVLDRAGWHVSGRVEVPEGVRLVFLPPYSPELQPVERVWPLVNEAVANRYFQDLEEMMEVVAERCRVLAQDPETLRRHTLFHWWPRTKALA
jgi:transposase